MKQSPFFVKIIILIMLVCFISGSIMSQKVAPDTLNIDQLNLYRHKAVAMRNTGMGLTLGGVVIAATGFIIGVNSFPEQNPDEPVMALGSYYFIGITGMVGIASTAVGIPLWAVGGSRKAKAEISLQKWKATPENSLVIGLGITMRF